MLKKQNLMIPSTEAKAIFKRNHSPNLAFETNTFSLLILEQHLAADTQLNITPLEANEGKLLLRVNKIIGGHILDKFRYNTVDVSHVVQYTV